jgi:hypothetical protein
MKEMFKYIPNAEEIHFYHETDQFYKLFIQTLVVLDIAPHLIPPTETDLVRLELAKENEEETRKEVAHLPI